MARAALAWGVLDLAREASVSTQTIVRFERGEQLRSSTIASLQTALEAAGIEFIPENGGGAGVRFSTPARKAD
jgi:DNA-binding XRE family transcriptional regulator